MHLHKIAYFISECRMMIISPVYYIMNKRHEFRKEDKKMAMNFDLTGKVAMVTGASSGLGAQMAQQEK